MDNNKDYAFFAMMARLKYINRWALMRNSENENLSEHSLEVAMLAHALCVIGNTRLGKELDEGMAAMIGLYHDVSEILTGDMPTPVKYLNAEIKEAYKDIEKEADRKLLSLLPEDMRSTYEELLMPGEKYAYEKRLVKGADKLSAYIKCLHEKKAGNDEFRDAEMSTLKQLDNMGLKEVSIFLDEFLPAYSKTLDEIKP